MSAAAIPALGLSLGSLEVGILVSTFLFGVTTVQCYIYYSSNARDTWYIKLLIPCVWLLEAFHTTSMCYFLYWLTVTNYGNLEALAAGHWPLNVSATCDGLVGALVQSFFAYRIYTLTGKWYITLISWLGSATAFAMTFAITILSFKLSVAAFSINYSWLATSGLSVLLFVDVVNTAALCTYLRIERTGFNSTDSLLNKLFLWTLETGLLTSVAAILMVVFLLTEKSTTLWVCISIFYAKLYSNSLMASLNGREYLRSARMDTNVTGSTTRASGGMMNFSTGLSRSQPTYNSHDLELSNYRQDETMIGSGIEKVDAKARLSKDEDYLGPVAI